MTVNKPLTYALLLAATLGLAACEKTPEDKMESAKESASEAMENLGDAAKETGEAIGVGRLMARPTASLSLEAQQRRELKQKMFGD